MTLRSLGLSSFINFCSESKAIRNYNYPIYDDLDDFDEPIPLPKRLPEQVCPRCDNQFPGGLKRCTACGLEVNKAIIKPEIATPWPGFERGVIECSGCGYTSSDELARRGRIQKCIQCAKVLYIPSGLYRSERPAGKLAYSHTPRHSVWWFLRDRVGAKLNRFSRSKVRFPIAVLIIFLGIGLLLGLNYWKTQSQKVPVGPSELSIYYNKVLDMNKLLKQDELEYDRGAGGTPSAGDYADRISPNNQKRFVRATDRMLKQDEDLLFNVYAMSGAIPAGAESHYAKLKTKLEERQRYYARLKDAVDQKNEARWNEAFANYDLMRNSGLAEEQALNNLQALILKPTPGS